MNIKKAFGFKKQLSDLFRQMNDYMNRFPEFNRLAEEKQNRIIKAALEEFAIHGYRNASTNSIVSKAGIGKGMLFVYFRSKKDLCIYLFYKVIMLTITSHAKLFLQLAKKKKDIVELATLIGLERIKFVKQYPIESQFLMMIFIKPPQELSQEIQNFKIKTFSHARDLFFSMLDFKNIRKEIDKETVQNAVLFVLEGIYRSIVNSDSFVNISILDKDFDDKIEVLRNDILKYMEILKYGMYEVN